MRNALFTFVDKLLYSNVYIAFAAFLFSSQSLAIAGVSDTNKVAAFVFSLTLVHYNLHRLFALKSIGRFTLLTDVPTDHRANRLKHHGNSSLMFMILGLGGLIYLFYFYPKLFNWYWSLPILFAILYTFPLGPYHLRRIPFVKSIVVGIVWACVCVFIPLLSAELSKPIFLTLLIEKCLFITALTIPFNIRDVKIDLENQTKTLANFYGRDTAIAVSIFLLCFCSFSLVFLCLSGLYSVLLTKIMLLFYVVVAYIIQTERLKFLGDWYYLLVLDGLIILQSILTIFVLK